MDSLSQLVLGAATAEAVIGKKVGNRAILWGAIGGTIPDLDVFIRPFVHEVTATDWHRGVSHSLLLFVFLSPLLGWLITKIYKGNWGSGREWTLAMFLTLFTHVLLDCFTTWGTQIFWPLDYRVAWHTVFVADPLYTLPLLVTVVWVLFIKRVKPRRQLINWVGIALSTGYLLLTVVHKSIADRFFESALAKQGIQVEYFESRPTPLNSFLWTLSAKSGDGYYMAYHSLFDRMSPEDVRFVYIAQNKGFADEFRASEKLQRLVFLSQGYYKFERIANGIRFMDLRFGVPNEMTVDGDGFLFGYDITGDRVDPVISSIADAEPSAEEGEKALVELWERLKGLSTDELKPSASETENQ